MKTFIYKFRYLLLILFSTLIFLFINNTNVQAYTYEGYEFPEMPEDFNNFEYKVIYYDDLNKVYNLLLSDHPFLYDNSCITNEEYACFLITYNHYKRYKWSPSSTENIGWYIYADNSNSRLSYLHIVLDGIRNPLLGVGFQIVYSSHTIYHGIDDQEGESFFYLTPLMNSTNMQFFVGVTICQMIMPMIPVSLILLSILLVIFLVRLVILRMF